MKKTREFIVGLLVVLCSFVMLFGFSGCDFGGLTNGTHQNSTSNSNNTETSSDIEVKIYIDGSYDSSIYTNSKKNYKITEPEKPEDITTNPNSEKYFYGWFVDSHFQTPLTENTTFTKDSKIYGKWVTVYSNAFEYTVNYGEATITGFSNTTATTVVVPCYINSFPVTTIASDTFKDKTMITTVIVCNGIKNIESNAFYNCNSMKEISIPESVENIESCAFEKCAILNKINVDSKSHYYKVKNNALYTKDEKTLVSAYANVTDYEIPNTTEEIFCGAFGSCTKLTSITIPFIGAKAEDTENAYFGYIFGRYSSSRDSLNYYVPSTLKTVKLSKGTTIPDAAFYNCDSLTHIILPNTITSIGNSSFAGCSNLTQVAIPNSVTTVSSSAFSGCDSLKYNEYDNAYYLGNKNNPYMILITAKEQSITSCEIAQTTIFICDAAFHSCSSLTSIVVPESVKSIGVRVFGGCYNLVNLTLPFIGASRTATGYQAVLGYIFGCTTLQSWNKSIGTFQYHDSSVSYGYYHYYIPSSLTSITISEGITNIPANAFYNCNNLTSISIPDSITSIGKKAFDGCINLTNITIPDSVTSIGDYAFADCDSLVSITIPDSVTSIGDRAFADCDSIKIYCEAESKPSGWNSDWNRTGNYNYYYTVVWGYKQEN